MSWKSSFLIQMFRTLKKILFSFRIIERRVEKNAKSVIIFENGFSSSDYYSWVNSIAPTNVNIIQLELNPIYFNPPSRQAEVLSLLKYKNIFFHSPGEEMQAKLLGLLDKLKFRGNTVGLQHGFIGRVAPSALPRVLNTSKASYYVSFESLFTKYLKLNTDAKVIEHLFIDYELKDVNEYPRALTCYFDAPDKGSLFKTAAQLHSFLRGKPIKIKSLRFHPSTSVIKKTLICLYLHRYSQTDHSEASKSAICWDSKVKYELITDGQDVYTFDSKNKLNMICLSCESVTFNDHVRLTLDHLDNNGFDKTFNKVMLEKV